LPRILQAVLCRPDDRWNRAGEGDQAGGEDCARTDVTDVRAPDLARAHFREKERASGRRIRGEIRVDRRQRHGDVLAEIDSSGSRTSHDSTPPANIVPAIRGPMT
jgi:hypothetical protein